jgi:hypothetical protein
VVTNGRVRDVSGGTATLRDPRSAVAIVPGVAAPTSARPLITAVIPTRDRAHFLRSAVESYHAAAREVGGRADVEIIVVDNSSTPERAAASQAVATELGVTFVTSSPAGLSRARNTGWRAGSGEVVSFLDDDDAVLPNFFLTLLDELERHERAGAAFGQMLMCDDALERPSSVAYPTPPFPSGEAFRFCVATIIQQNAVLFRRAALEDIDGYDESLPQSEDWDVMLRLSARHDVVGVAVPVCKIRQHSGLRMTNNMTYAQWKRYVADCEIVDRRCRTLQPRVRVPVVVRRASGLRRRGQSAYNAIQMAIEARAGGNADDGRRFVVGAFRRSPLHAAKLVVSHRRELLPLLRPTRAE